MPTHHASDRLPFAALLIAVLLVPACSGTSVQVQRVPEDGFTQTRNYQFQARIRADTLGNCETMTVRVKGVNKLYMRGAPPSRLRLFDDDCARPVQFERVEYVSRETQHHVRLSGFEVARFLSGHGRLEHELMRWLWREQVF